MQEIIIGSIPLLVAFIVALVRYRKLEPAWLRLFPWFMILTFCIQIWGFVYSLPPERKSNHFIFNAYTFLEYGFYLWALYRASVYNRTKRMIVSAWGIFVLVYTYELFVAGSFYVYSSFACNTGNFLTLLCCMLYLFELLMAERIIYFFRTTMFWIVSGLMFECLGGFFYLCFFDYIVKNNVDGDGVIYGLINTITTVVEYAFFIVGILITKNE